MSLMENLVVGGLAILLLFWMGPGVKVALKRSEGATADWFSVFLPIAWVVMFVLFLLAMV